MVAMSLFLRRVTALATFGIVAACGGKVIWVPDGNGGASSTATSTSTFFTTSDGVPAPQASVAVSTGGGDACSVFCAIPGCAGPNCSANCQDLYNKGCDDE